MAGRKPGTPKTGGRKKGTPNKATAEVRSIAQLYGAQAIETLAEIMNDQEQLPAARVSAAKEILDRGYGKSPQPIEGPGFENAADLLRQIGERLAA